MSTATNHYADLDGVTLHYRRAGRGEPVVLVHGIPQTSHEWRYVLPRLAERYTVIAPDLRGLGDSSRPPGAYDKKTLGADIAALVIDHLGFGKFHLVGHDWGGPVAFSVAAHNPEAVRTLTILDVVIPGDGGDFSQGGRRWHHAFFRTLDLPEQLCFGREELVINWLFENYGYRANCISDEDKAEFLRTYKKPGAFRALLEIYRALPQDAEDNRTILARNGKLKMPVLALGGDKSFGRGSECVESLRRVAENVRGGIVKDCGHWIAEEQPEFLAEQLLDLFRQFPIQTDD
jgi:pimeloyl-ACP methyl ester carboxylesterase